MHAAFAAYAAIRSGAYLAPPAQPPPQPSLPKQPLVAARAPRRLFCRSRGLRCLSSLVLRRVPRAARSAAHAASLRKQPPAVRVTRAAWSAVHAAFAALSSLTRLRVHRAARSAAHAASPPSAAPHGGARLAPPALPPTRPSLPKQPPAVARASRRLLRRPRGLCCLPRPHAAAPASRRLLCRPRGTRCLSSFTRQRMPRAACSAARAAFAAFCGLTRPCLPRAARSAAHAAHAASVASHGSACLAPPALPPTRRLPPRTQGFCVAATPTCVAALRTRDKPFLVCPGTK